MKFRICAAVIIAALFITGRAYADSLDIDVRLQPDGSAEIVEIWDMTVHEGTEMYLVRQNLEDISIWDFQVSDENGKYYYMGKWDVDRSLSQKAGMCGVVYTGKGCELCWGLGSYGHHTWRVSYTMTNVVKSLNDYDCLHMQFVSPGINQVPSDVSLRITLPGTVLSQENAAIWGFGYEGDIVFTEGGVSAHSSVFDRRSSMIVLMRLDKGMVTSPSVSDKTFDEVREKAFKGSSYENDREETFVMILVTVILFLFLAVVIWIVVRSTRNERERITGYRSLKDISWSREVPFEGNLLESNYIFGKLYGVRDAGSVTSALMLRMIQHGVLLVGKDGNKEGKVVVSFNDNADFSALPECCKGLCAILREAAGKDRVLQDKEFSRWCASSESRRKTVSTWIDSVEDESRRALVSDGYMSPAGKWKEAVRLQGERLVGFRKFLKDFTLLSERASIDVAVWNDYLVYAAMFGIADKVAKELGNINPQLFDQTVYGDYTTAYHVVRMTRRMSSSLIAASVSYQSAAGRGGRSSFGGGGGFSGGGFGGGVR